MLLYIPIRSTFKAEVFKKKKKRVLTLVYPSVCHYVTPSLPEKLPAESHTFQDRLVW